MEANFEALNQFLGLLIDQDDLHIYKKLNEGVFYEVHKAETLADQTCCCVRFRKPDTMISANDQKRFFHEILYQHSLKHETILPLIGYVIPKTGTDKYAIITDYMPHASLNELINLVNTGSPPENWETIKAINIFGIAAGMTYIHQHNLIHCDLKPEHILLDENYYPKIGGFNSSICTKPASQDNIPEKNGTLLYKAPEIIEESDYTNKIDVYSYAILLYKLLTLKEPFYECGRNISTYKLMRNVVNGKRPCTENLRIPSSLLELINLCWAPSPDERPSFKKIVKEFMDHKSEIFNLDLINKEEFDKYIEKATKDLDIPNDDDIVYETVIAGIQP